MAHITAAFIGLGLIGGSIAKGLKRRDPSIRIMAYMRTRQTLEKAKQDGIVDVILDGVGEALRGCDIVFLCTPVEYNAAYMSQIRPFLKEGAILTDVGSTKSDIHVVMLFAIILRSIVFPTFGGATIIPRCPFPTGEIRSIKRMAYSSLVVSSFKRSSG